MSSEHDRRCFQRQTICVSPLERAFLPACLHVPVVASRSVPNFFTSIWRKLWSCPLRLIIPLRIYFQKWCPLYLRISCSVTLQSNTFILLKENRWFLHPDKVMYKVRALGHATRHCLSFSWKPQHWHFSHLSPSQSYIYLFSGLIKVIYRIWPFAQASWWQPSSHFSWFCYRFWGIL